jgi:hypothetical protein
MSAQRSGGRSCLQRSGRRANWHPLLLSAVAGVSLLKWTGAHAAAFEPGTSTASVVAAIPAQAPDAQAQGTGIQWQLAPLVYSGSLSLDGRWQHARAGQSLRQFLTIGDINFSTHVWQPWFVQLRFGLGFVLARDRLEEAGLPTRSSSQPSATGRFAVSVFPMSRFPFELRAEVGDSRVRGDAIGNDFRTERLTLTQAYAPESGDSQYTLMVDRGQRTTFDGAKEVVSDITGTATRHWDDHQLNVHAQHLVNQFSHTGSETRNSALSLNHHRGDASFQTNSLASWNRARFVDGDPAMAFDLSTDIRQLSTFASWRPRAGEWLYAEQSPTQLTASARVLQTRHSGAGGDLDQQSLNLALGLAKDLTPEWRLAGNTAASVFRSGEQASSHFASASLGLSYAPAALPWGAWRYAPSLGVSAGLSQSSQDGGRRSLVVQAAHALSRSHELGENDSVSLSFSQDLSVSRESERAAETRQLVHASSVSWQGYGGDASQSYASLTLSDARTQAETESSFQLFNLQLSRRTQLSRDASWSGNVTLQASRSHDGMANTLPADPFNRFASQRFYSGSLTYEHQRAFGVPRLRFSTTLTVNSQQLDNRTPGDFDSPPEAVTQSIEGRFDYSIGRLNTYLTLRWAEVDQRRLASLFFRVQRQF